jgi:hypothetical protein
MTAARLAPCWLAALLLLSQAGCDDADAAADLRCGGASCSRDCRNLAWGTCDVLDPGCHMRVLQAVSCARGSTGRLPAIRVVSESEYERELNEEATSDGGVRDGAAAGADDDAGLDGPSGDPRTSELDAWSIALGLLGLLPAGTDFRSSAIESSVNAVAGYYDSSKQSITLIDRGEPQDDWAAVEIFAHELMHALQDQSLGLSELRTRAASYGDGTFAHSCLIEGEAELYAELAVALLRGVPFDAAQYDSQLRSRLKYSRRAVVDASAPFAAMWRLRYPIGARYLFDAYRQDGHWAVQALFEATPSSTVHWMVGYEENEARREHLVLPLACDLAAAPPGYRLDDEVSFGAAALYAFLGHSLRRPDGVLTSEEQWRNALRWRQDSFSVFTNDAGQVAVSYRVRFADEALAVTLAAELAASTVVALKVVHRGKEIELLAAEEPALLDGWHTDPDACPLPP